MKLAEGDQRVLEFRRQRRMFAVVNGVLRLCREGDERDHRRWFACEGWSDRYIKTTRGFIDATGVYAYSGGDLFMDGLDVEPDIVANADVLARHVQADAIVWSGMHRGEPGLRWKPVRRLGTLDELLGGSAVVSVPIRLKPELLDMLRNVLGDEKAVDLFVRRAIGAEAERKVLELLREECRPHVPKRLRAGPDSSELFECARCGEAWWD